MGLLIVGGGIGGLTLGVALERRGLEYVLLEQAPAIDTVGAGLLLSPNATRLLRKLDLLDRITHLHHHRRFPHEDDIEAYSAAQGFVRALLWGPGHQTRLFLWAWRRANPTERAWMAVEAGAILAVLTAATTATPGALYALLVITSGWLYPLATVWWPHRSHGDSALEHTRAFRGRLIPALFLQHTYHLEHHLYPMVASVNWKELARRLEPHVRQACVEPVRLP